MALKLLNIGYDYDFDILGLILAEDYVYKYSDEIANGVILDFDKNDNIVALEVLDASVKLGIVKDELRRQIGDEKIMNYGIYGETIKKHFSDNLNDEFMIRKNDCEYIRGDVVQAYIKDLKSNGDFKSSLSKPVLQK